MSWGERVKEFIQKLRIFIWYLFTEPGRQVTEIWFKFMSILRTLNKTLTWVYVAIIFMVISLFLGKRFIAGVFLIFLLFVVILWEWESGNFMYRYREKIREKAKKIQEEEKIPDKEEREFEEEEETNG